MLKLDSPSTFDGVIYNFTGTGSLSSSDQIDLKGINFNSVSDSYSNGVLTVTDGTNSAALDFNGSFTLANFKFASDGSGGTIFTIRRGRRPRAALRRRKSCMIQVSARWISNWRCSHSTWLRHFRRRLWATTMLLLAVRLNSAEHSSRKLLSPSPINGTLEHWLGLEFRTDPFWRWAGTRLAH